MPLFLGALAASLVLGRLLLAMRGGVFFFPDEARYHASFAIAKALLAGDFASLPALISSPDHPGFKLFMAAPAAAELLLGRTPGSLAVIANAVASAGIAFFLAWVAGRLSEPEHRARARLLALFAALLSPSLQLYSRHLLPYDLSLLFLSASAAFSIRGGKAGLALSGGFAALGVGTYLGHWALGLLAPLAFLLERKRPGAPIAFALLGVMIPTAVFLGLVALELPLGEYLRRVLAFSRTIHQGEMREGPLLLLEWLIRTEPGALFTCALAAVLGFARASARRALFVAVGIAILLSLLSWGLGRFTVYGRLARQVVPLLLLSFAVALAAAPRARTIALAALFLFPTLLPLSKVWSMRFPADFLEEASLRYGSPIRVSDVFDPRFAPGAAAIPPGTVYVLNAHRYPYFFAPPHALPAHETLLEAPHPLEWRPLQLEGFTPAQREFLDERIRMKAVRFR